ncbi:hypothetical protein C8R45DRAFT_544097, partial [Mycena sanguinolenta]
CVHCRRPRSSILALVRVSSESDDHGPRLPLELECSIFKIVALACPIHIPTLMLVARRVKYWVEPILYRVAFLKGSTTDHSELRDLNLPIFTADALEQRSPNSFRHVKHLFISDYAVEQPMLNNWLLACTGVTNLYAWLDWEPEIPASISRFTHVQYLAIDVRAFFGTAVPLPLFLTVTHLELLDYPEDESVDHICHNISLIPRLTHLALNPHLDSKLSHAALCANIQLRCIVFLSPAKSLRDSPLLDDDRFVCIDEAEDFYQD